MPEAQALPQAAVVPEAKQPPVVAREINNPGAVEGGSDRPQGEIQPKALERFTQIMQGSDVNTALQDVADGALIPSPIQEGDGSTAADTFTAMTEHSADNRARTPQTENPHEPGFTKEQYAQAKQSTVEQTTQQAAAEPNAEGPKQSPLTAQELAAQATATADRLYAQAQTNPDLHAEVDKYAGIAGAINTAQQQGAEGQSLAANLATLRVDAERRYFDKSTPDADRNKALAEANAYANAIDFVQSAEQQRAVSPGTQPEAATQPLPVVEAQQPTPVVTPEQGPPQAAAEPQAKTQSQAETVNPAAKAEAPTPTPPPTETPQAKVTEAAEPQAQKTETPEATAEQKRLVEQRMKMAELGYDLAQKIGPAKARALLEQMGPEILAANISNENALFLLAQAAESSQGARAIDALVKSQSKDTNLTPDEIATRAQERQNLVNMGTLGARLAELGVTDEHAAGVNEGLKQCAENPELMNMMLEVFKGMNAKGNVAEQADAIAGALTATATEAERKGDSLLKQLLEAIIKILKAIAKPALKGALIAGGTALVVGGATAIAAGGAALEGVKKIG